MAENVAASIRSDGGQSIAAVADVSSLREVDAMFEKVKEEFGPVTGLVNNAATEGSQGRIEDMNPEATRRSVRHGVGNQQQQYPYGQSGFRLPGTQERVELGWVSLWSIFPPLAAT